MNNSYTYLSIRLSQLKILKKRVEKLGSKINTFTEKYNKLLKLIEKTDGLAKIPKSLKNIQNRKRILEFGMMQTMPKSFGNIKIAVRGITACEMAVDVFCRKYESTIDELIELYSEKYKIMEIMNSKNKKTSDKLNMNKDQNIDHNYKLEAIKAIELFELFGVTDENNLKVSNKNNVMLDKKAKDSLINLKDVVNNVSSFEVTNTDVIEIKDILSKIGRMNMLSEEEKNREYENIDEYIAKLAGKSMRIRRNTGEDISDNKINDKLEAMKTLGSLNINELTEKDLIKIAKVNSEDFDKISYLYLHELVNAIKSVSSSDLVSEDANKIKDAVVALSKIRELDDENKERSYENINDLISELSNKKGNSK